MRPDDAQIFFNLESSLDNHASVFFFFFHSLVVVWMG